ncbi:MAG TPA: PIN domain-containing protein [Thermoanaerobaculia bacterium]|jgi:predicted nucleic acid-binding protein|nr:PIN domain-containing protein [Thermoanaerobaculia bacterium]
MRRGLDTNVLIYAHMPDLPDHVRVRRFLLGQLADEDVSLVITPIILHEFVHIITDGRRFDPPVSIADAIAVARVYLDHTNVECLSLDGQAVAGAFSLIERHQLGRKRIADTLFAACLLGHGVHELITCNPNDFRIFGSLTLTDPRNS